MMKASNPTSQPMQDMTMFKFQRRLSRASSYPFIGIVPASLKLGVSVIEVVAASAFLLMLEAGGKKLCSSDFIKHEIKACENHVNIGVISGAYSLLGIATIGWGPWIVENTTLKSE